MSFIVRWLAATVAGWAMTAACTQQASLVEQRETDAQPTATATARVEQATATSAARIPTRQATVVAQQPTPAPRSGCDPSYPDVCIPPPPPDLDCPDIPHRRFRVVQPDPHRFDSDRDGIGCES